MDSGFAKFFNVTDKLSGTSAVVDKIVPEIDSQIAYTTPPTTSSAPITSLATLNKFVDY